MTENARRLVCACLCLRASRLHARKALQHHQQPWSARQLNIDFKAKAYISSSSSHHHHRQQQRTAAAEWNNDADGDGGAWIEGIYSICRIVRGKPSSITRSTPSGISRPLFDHTVGRSGHWFDPVRKTASTTWFIYVYTSVLHVCHLFHSF